MVQPLRIGVAACGVLLLWSSSAAAAEALPFACEAGVVLAPPEAESVVTRGCESAHARGGSGRFRIGVVAAGPKIVVTVTRVPDSSGVERTARGEAASMEEARRLVDSAVDAVADRRAPPPPAPTAAPPAIAPTPAPAPPPAAPTKKEDASRERTVHVVLKTPSGVRILQSRDGSGDWEFVCASTTCEKELPVDASYRVVDDSDGHLLKGFRLDPNGRESLVVDVSTRSVGLDVLGVGALLGGTALFIGGDAGGNAGVALLGILVGVGGAAALVVNGTSVSQTAPRSNHPDDRVVRPPHEISGPTPMSFTTSLVSVTF
jgi:hypothetical protein